MTQLVNQFCYESTQTEKLNNKERYKMKKILLTTTLLLALTGVLLAQWVPISVNTNTWECKPSGTWGTNYWDNIGTIPTTPTTPTTSTTPTSSPPISVSSPYYTAELWYDFVVNNGTGTNIIDATGNGEDGHEVSVLPIQYNQLNWQDYSIACKEAKQSGLSTDNTALLYGAANMSVGLWMRLEENTKSGESYNALFASADGYGLRIVHQDEVVAQNEFTISDGDSVVSTTPFTLITNVWTHIVFTRTKGDNLNVYVNGSLVSSDAVLDVPVYVDSSVHLGGSIVGSWQIDASYDDFAMWSRILTSTEITNLYINARSTNALWYSESEWD